MKIKYRFLLLVLCMICLIQHDIRSCTALIAGKKTTTDGSILFAKSEDDDMQLDYYWHIPRRNNNENSFVSELGGLDIPQVNETYSYFWDQSPKMVFSNVIINEWGIAFGSNGCISKEDPAEALSARGDILDGGIGYSLRFMLAERCKTARDAVLLAKELINTYGYNGSGRCLNIVDPNEAWQLQMVCGKHFVARRVQDDEVAIIANTFTIREINLEDTVNFICSPDIIDYAIKRGWYDPEKNGDFDFSEAYASEKHHKGDWNTHRTWMLAKLINKDFPISVERAENGEMPVSVKPDRKLSLEDLMNIFRNHYENTDLCKYAAAGISPHHIDNTPVCNDATHKVNIIQQRSWMPVEIGTVNWRALSHPCQSIFIPWYLGIKTIPEAYQKAYEDPDFTEKNLLFYHFTGPDWQLRETDFNSASCVFRLLNHLSDSEYGENNILIRNTFKKIESDLLLQQPVIEKEALRLYGLDKNKAFVYLTNYTCSKAGLGFDKAKDLIKSIVNAYEH